MDESYGMDAHENFPGSGSDKRPRMWSSSPDHRTYPATGERIFCNRSLNMKNIVAVGFDMDYTLAQYMPKTFESLAYRGTVEQLVYELGYPRELLSWSLDWTYMVRGLVVDKKRGNVLKMDCHKYVKVAYHGFKELSKEDKARIYGNTVVRDSFDVPNFALPLGEVYLFTELVDFKDENPGNIPDADYARMYEDIQTAFDLYDQDGPFRQMVTEDPKRYIKEDISIVPMLKMLRQSGRATFLVTNSLWDYTNIVMNFLCGTSVIDGSTKFDWLQYFDVVITGSAKPRFFHEEKQANLFEVELETGRLLRTDNSSSIAMVGNISARLSTEEMGRPCKVFQGGNVGHLHKLLSIESSSQVLYVGYQIYGDILRSKKALGWRTMLVVPELENELEVLWELRDARKELQFLRKERDRIEDEIHNLQWSLKHKNLDDDAERELRSQLDRATLERDTVRLSHQEAQRELHRMFQQPWGQLMRTGYQKSRFAHQVERYACLYTSQVTNLALYPPDQYYRPAEDYMQHEFSIVPYELSFEEI